MSYDRKHAIELGAISLSDLLTKAGLSSILAQLTAAQIRQLQSYLDAAVIDPVVKQQADAIYRQGTIVNGQVVYTPPETQRKIDKAMREYIPVGKYDDTVRIDLSKALDAKALKPITDNPDEADYLQTVRQWLDKYGVWLRLDVRLVRNPDDPSQWINDGKHFDAWLSLGPRGDAIPTKTGIIDRDALLSTQIIGADYWTKVDNGRVMTALNRQVQLLRSQIEDGMALHVQMTMIRGQAAPGVVAVSDLLGGASFPSIDMWESPNQLLIAAMQLSNGGRVWGANVLVVIGAIYARNAANVLNAFVDDTTAGAAISVKALKVARTAGHVAEVGLLIASGVGAAGAGAAGGAAAGDAAVDAAAEKELAQYLARNPDVASEVNSVKSVAGPRGTVLRGGGRGAEKGFQSW